ncbi:uncharacterized protein LOC127526145 [Erpetoichthys calabaricus]|uniref:uncharacterized protein LOC127526145 n=1 Tax=Erpetoichthys calabaricus TaxID=27687 RepID=UPI0022346EA7|nr:uncharacterized protein LOC127526145 [Erpetoichthys calabaricus]
MYSAANIYRTHHSHAQSRFYHGTTNVLKKGRIGVSLPCRSNTPVITEGRLSTHLGLFNRKVNSVDIERLLNEQNSNETISEQNISKVANSIANSQTTELSCTITAVQSQVPHLYDIESQDPHIQDSESVGVGVEGVSLGQQPAVSEEIISEMPNLPNQNFDQADDRSPDSHTNVSAITNLKMAEAHSHPPVLPDNKLVNIQSQSKNSTTNEMGMLSKKDKSVFLELETHKRGIGEMDVESGRPRVPVDEIASKLNRLIRKLPLQIGRDLLSETKVVLQRLLKERHERIPDMSQLHIQKNVDCQTVSASVEEGMLPRSEWKLPSDIGNRHLQASQLQLMQNMSRKRRRKTDFSRKMNEALNFSDQPFIILDNEEPFTILNQRSESPASYGEHSNPVLFETNFLHFDDEQNTTNTSFFTKFNLKPSVQADDIFHLAEPVTNEVDYVCISSSSTSLDSLKLSEKRTRSMSYPVTSYQSHAGDCQSSCTFNTANPPYDFPHWSLQTMQEGCHYSAFSMSPKFYSIDAVDPCHYTDNIFFLQ